jgi:putative ABC transport system permease protein
LKPASLIHLYRIRLRSRIGTELLALAGVAVGVALVFAALVANASLTGAVRELTAGIVGRADFQLAARSAEGFDRQALRRVEAIPGAAAAPVAEARVNLVAGAGERRSVLLVGADRAASAIGGVLLRSTQLTAPRGPPGLFLPAPLAAGLGVEEGDGVRVETGGGVTRARVSGVLDDGEVGGLAESPVALAPLPLVQRLAGMEGRFSRVFVDAAGGREGEVETALREAAGDRLNLGPADGEAAVFERASYPASRSTALFSVLSALVGFLFALNAVLLSVPQRRRLIADLRTAGYPPASVVEVAILDALLLGIAGTAAGLALGEVASRQLFDSVPGYLTSAFAVGSQRSVTWQSAALAAAAGVLAACLAVLVPLRRFLRAGGSRRRLALPAPRRQGLVLVAGGAVLAVALAIAVLVPTLALAALAALLTSLLLLLGAWLRAALGAIASVCGRARSPVAILAGFELRAGSARLRTLALAGTGAVAVFAAVAIGGARVDLQRGLDGIAADLNRGAGVWIAFRGPTSIFATTAISMPPRRLREIEALRGVRAVRGSRGGFLDVGGNRVWVLAPDPSRVGWVLRRQVEAGDPALAADRLRGGGWVALSRGLGSELGVGVGDPVELPFPEPARLRTAALTDNFGWPGGAIVVGAPDYARASGSAAASSYGIRLRRGSSATVTAAAVRSILGPRSSLLAETVAERTRRQRAASRDGLSRLGQISALVLISSVLAMAASMAGLVWQRRPRFAALKLHGLGEGQLWGALLLEAGLLLAMGCLAGAAFGLVGQLILDRALGAITGFPVVYETAWQRALVVVCLLDLAAAAVLALPGWLAVRVSPREGPEEATAQPDP